MALTKIMGQNFRLTEASTCFTEATACSVTIQGNVEDAQTKDNASAFARDQMVSRGWTAQVDTYNVSVAALRKYIAAFIAQGGTGSGSAGIQIGWDQTAGENNSVAQSASFARSGLAWLTDFSLTANNRTTCQLSLQFTGNGAIA